VHAIVTSYQSLRYVLFPSRLLRFFGQLRFQIIDLILLPEAVVGAQQHYAQTFDFRLNPDEMIGIDLSGLVRPAQQSFQFADLWVRRIRGQKRLQFCDDVL
jgi:hypothetical protein